MADEENNNEENNEAESPDGDEVPTSSDDESVGENEEDKSSEDDEDPSEEQNDDSGEESEEGEEQENEEDDDSEKENEDEQDEGEEDDENEEMGEDVEVPEKFADIVEEIEEMPVVELNELVSLLEKKWGVSAQAVAAGGGGGGEEEEEEKDAYDVELTDFGDSKISVIKAVKAGLGLGLKEAKGMVEDAPVVLKEGMDTEEAEELKENIEEEGGTVELK